jgi:hypothetical protein
MLSTHCLYLSRTHVYHKSIITEADIFFVASRQLSIFAASRQLNFPVDSHNSVIIRP